MAQPGKINEGAEQRQEIIPAYYAVTAEGTVDLTGMIRRLRAANEMAQNVLGGIVSGLGPKGQLIIEVSSDRTIFVIGSVHEELLVAYPDAGLVRPVTQEERARVIRLQNYILKQAGVQAVLAAFPPVSAKSESHNEFPELKVILRDEEAVSKHRHFSVVDHTAKMIKGLLPQKRGDVEHQSQRARRKIA